MVAQGITVAIPTKDRPAGLCAVVRDLWEGTRRPEEILVVCQGAAVETARQLSREVPEPTPHIRFYASSRRGTNASRNDAVRLASGDFLAFTDDDMRLPADWLETMLALWQGEWAGEDVLLTGPILSPDDIGPPGAAPGRRVGEERRVWRTPPLSGDVLYGGHFGAPRSAFARLGETPFDERFGPGARLPGAGDEEFALQLLRTGVPIAFEPALQATHVAPPSAWVRDQFQHCQGSGALFVARRKWDHQPAASRAVATRIAKGFKAAARLRLREAAGRFAGLAGLAIGAWRWRLGGVQAWPRALEPQAGDLTLVELR